MDRLLNVERLRALSAVAAHGTISEAARALHMTHSAVSQQLAKLEREAGHPLLEPNGRSVRLTHAGRVLLTHAEQILDRLAAARTDLADLHAEVIGPLCVGAVGSAVRTLLPDALVTLTEAHPRLTPTVCDGEVIDLMPRLLTGELDLLIIESWDNRPVAIPQGVTLRTLIREPADIALPDAHPLAGRETIDLAELPDTPWSSCPPGTESHEALVQALRDNGTEPAVRYTLADYSTQLTLVARGLAAALVPVSGRNPAPPGVTFIPVRPTLHRELQLAWRPQTATAPTRACIAVLTEALEPTAAAAPSLASAPTADGASAAAE
ncbi:MAG: LysR family transcriptional regulator [Streptosporangiales bacterium]|nr:LysR family transcriptional regulator [Streptosporangiales bacterium]